MMNSKLLSIKDYIEKKYSETAYFYFAITDIHFNCSQRDPILNVEVSHYNSSIKTLLVFRGFQFYLVSEESYIPHFDNEDFSGFSFVTILNKYSLVDILKQKGFDLQFELRDKNPEDFFIFRVVTQNYFIDVYTDKLPEILY